VTPVETPVTPVQLWSSATQAACAASSVANACDAASGAVANVPGSGVLKRHAAALGARQWALGSAPLVTVACSGASSLSVRVE